MQRLSPGSFRWGCRVLAGALPPVRALVEGKAAGQFYSLLVCVEIPTNWDPTDFLVIGLHVCPWI